MRTFMAYRPTDRVVSVFTTWSLLTLGVHWIFGV